MSGRKITLEEFARRIKTNDFHAAYFYYLAYIHSGMSLREWLNNKPKPPLKRKNIRRL